jgi:hypothetical protein
VTPKLAKPTIAWTVFVVAAILVLAIYPLGPEEGVLANALFVLQALTALVGLSALVVAIRATIIARR